MNMLTYQILSHRIFIKTDEENFYPGIKCLFPEEMHNGVKPLTTASFHLHPVPSKGTSKTVYKIFEDGELIFEDMDRDIVNTWLEWAVTASTLRYLNRYLQIHSGGVVKDGKAMIFIGESGAGKTSLLIGLSMMGLSLLSDDINLLDKDCHSIIPYPRNFLIKEDIINHIPQIVPFLNKTKGHFQSGKGKVWYLDPFLLGSGLYFKPSTPSEIIILERSKTPETDIWEASKAEMAIPLLKAVFNPVSKESDIMKFLPLLLREVKCYRISIGSLKEGVNKIINLLDRRR